MTVGDRFSAAEVRQELASLISSPLLVRSKRLCRFLTYIVEAALDGRQREIKEQTIAIEVFDRSPGFDPNRDNIVRIEASRLRHKLREYYESAGRDRTVRINIPKGTYVPVFEVVPHAAERAVEAVPGRTARRHWALAAITIALGALVLEASLEHRTQRSIDTTTENLYEQGRYLWNQRTRPSIIKSLDLYRQALARRSDYADAWAGLADSYAVLAGNGYVDSPSFVAPGIAAARRAIQINPRLGRAHASLAGNLTHTGDFISAEREFKTAVQLSPADATAHQWYGHFLTQQQRFDEALAELLKAEQLDPTQAIIVVNIGDLYLSKKDYAKALEQYRKAQSLQRNCIAAAVGVISVRLALGQYREGLAEIEPWHTLFPDDPGINNGIALCKRELARLRPHR